jgi:hypothetical protein
LDANNFKEEIKAETFVVMPQTQLIDRLKSVEKVQSARKIDDNDGAGNKGAFDQILEHEAEKQMKQGSEKEHNHQETDEASVHETGMDYYDNHARSAYFYMTFSTTDLKC